MNQVRRLIIRFLVQSPLLPSHNRWLEKTPRNILNFDQLMASDIPFKLIQIVRDGRDVIVSKHPNRAHAYWVPQGRWISTVERGLKYKDHPQVHTLRFEDLILDYEPTIKKILDYLEVDYHPQMKDWHQFATFRKSNAWKTNKVQPLMSNKIGQWQEPEHQEHINKFMQRERAVKLLKLYNYI